LEHCQPDDIIISASPEFLLRLPAERLGVRLIASKVGKYTGLYEGVNNDGEEKVRRLIREYPGTEISEFYSDSRNDTPLARLAEKAYLVNGGEILPWPGM
jgi:phosphoserine phosphatase